MGIVKIATSKSKASRSKSARKEGQDIEKSKFGKK